MLALTLEPIDKEVDEWEVRCKFKIARFLEKLDSGEYRIKNPNKPGKLVPPSKGLPEGTRSRMFTLLDKADREVARCHAYILPNGAYAGSGMLDPKRILYNGRVYQAKPKAEPEWYHTHPVYRWYAGKHKDFMSWWGPLRCKWLRY